jgi:hypothetical protein
MVAQNLHGMLQAMTGGTHQRQSRHFVRSGTQDSQSVKHEFVLAMATLCNACIAWLTVVA